MFSDTRTRLRLNFSSNLDLRSIRLRFRISSSSSSSRSSTIDRFCLNFSLHIFNITRSAGAMAMLESYLDLISRNGKSSDPRSNGPKSTLFEVRKDMSSTTTRGMRIISGGNTNDVRIRRSSKRSGWLQTFRSCINTPIIPITPPPDNAALVEDLEMKSSYKNR